MEKIPKRADVDQEGKEWKEWPADTEPQLDIITPTESPELPSAAGDVVQEITREEQSERLRNREIERIKRDRKKRRELN